MSLDPCSFTALATEATGSNSCTASTFNCTKTPEHDATFEHCLLLHISSRLPNRTDPVCLQKTDTVKPPTSDVTFQKWFTVTSSLRQASTGRVLQRNTDPFSRTTNPTNRCHCKKIIIQEYQPYRGRRERSPKTNKKWFLRWVFGTHCNVINGVLRLALDTKKSKLITHPRLSTN